MIVSIFLTFLSQCNKVNSYVGVRFNDRGVLFADRYYGLALVVF